MQKTRVQKSHATVPLRIEACGVPEGEDVVVAGVEAAHHHGQVVRLAPAVHKVAHLHQHKYFSPISHKYRQLKVTN